MNILQHISHSFRSIIMMIRKSSYFLSCNKAVEASAAMAIALCLLPVSMAAEDQEPQPAETVPAAGAAPSPLITSASEVEGVTLTDKVINPSGEGENKVIGLSTEIVVKLGENKGVDLSQKGLVVYFGRGTNSGAPIAVDVYGSNDNGGSFLEAPIGYAYFQFRGKDTHEFSGRIHYTGTYNAFKLVIRKVSSGRQAEFNKFNLFAIGDDEAYPAGRIDPLHIADEYYMGYENYDYRPNSGILDPRNHYGRNAGLYSDATPWGTDTSFEYKGQVYELPTFDKQNNAQMPHVTETTVYAMPGDIIPLTPYFDLPTSVNYKETYSHWYKYIPGVFNQDTQILVPSTQDYSLLKTGEHRLLDFWLTLHQWC